MGMHSAALLSLCSVLLAGCRVMYVDEEQKLHAPADKVSAGGIAMGVMAKG